MENKKSVAQMLIDIDRKKQQVLFPSGSTLLELDLTKPITKVRQPTAKKQYGRKPSNVNACHNPDSKDYIPPEGLKIGTDDQGNPVYW